MYMVIILILIPERILLTNDVANVVIIFRTPFLFI